MNDPPKDDPPKKRNTGGKAGRSGPATGNENAMRHGLKAGKLPSDAKYIEVRLNIFRRNLEAAVMDSKGEVSIPDAASIQTAMRWERHAALAQRWLTKSYDELKPQERLSFSREIAKASTERDKALRELGLGKTQTQDLWSDIDVIISKGEDNAD
jgi:hypothetical protein